MKVLPFNIRLLTPADRDWVDQKMIADWGAETVVAHGQVFRPSKLPGIVAESNSEPIGLITWHIECESCEIITLNSWRAEIGVGSALIKSVQQVAVQAGCSRLFLITTNNNLHALRFYQKRGFVISCIHINAINASRRLKPEIPLVDDDGLPIRDEIELELVL